MSEDLTADPVANSSFENSTLSTQDAEPRPNFHKQWQTERPKPTAKGSHILPKITRHGTNTSLLNEAIWNAPQDPHKPSSSSSSSSSDSDVEDLPTTKKQRGQHTRPQQNTRGSYARFNVGNEDYNTRGRVSKRDGRLNISVNETSNRGYLAKALGANFVRHLDRTSPATTEQNANEGTTGEVSRSSSRSSLKSSPKRPKLNIVVMVIGSRGDIQPFLKIGKSLKEYGHRVRIATHPAFKDFVEKDSGLEFFSVGGDPAELMAFMVKNPGMIPSMDTLKKGEIGRRRADMAEMFEGFWRSCINATDDEKDVMNLKMMGANSPFVADAIIANPPSFAHIHCAERLGIPLHLMFTFPYTPTQAFPHPLANIKKTNVDPGYTNFMSYPLVEMMTWQGLGDLVNNFRVNTLGLEPVSTLWAPGQLYRLKVPYTYLWSPGLVPKPKDWGPEIDIAGFVFLDLASSFEPPAPLVKFLEAGDPPIYIGFGSIVVDDPDKFTKMIFEAVKKAGVRALVSRGWGGLGDDNTPDNIFMLENTPHDWLFPKVQAVVHHGGAGTTAIGLKCGRPTLIVPFFGDQQFWGARISESKAGAEPISYKSLTVDKLADGIRQLLTPEAKENAAKIAASIEAEGNGAQNAVRSFHRSLVLRGDHSMRCSILDERVAVWSMKNTQLRFSALAADILVEQRKISWKHLRLIRHTEWNDFEGPGEPLTGGATAIMGTVTGIAAGVGSVPFRLAKTGKKRARHEEKKRRKSEQRETKKGGYSNKEKRDSNKTKQVPTTGTLKPPKTGAQRQDTETRDYSSKKEGCTQGRSIAQSENTPELDENKNFQVDNNSPLSPILGKHNSRGEPIREKDEDSKDAETDFSDEDSDLSEDPDDNTVEEMAQNVGSGFGRTAEALARAPMDLSLAVAQGFHNAPRLYGDTTVRRPARITGYKSGLKAAGQEFAYGVYDGFSGLVMQPYTGARNNGAIGFVKGVGMGLTGFVLKDLAAILGPFGFTLKGVHKEMLKSKQPTAFIRRARIVQGQRDLNYLDDKAKEEARERVFHGWSVVQQVWAMMEKKRSHGFRGRVMALRERKAWRDNGGFDSVKMAEKALEARREGQSLEEVFAEKRVESRKANEPRRDVVDDMERNRLFEEDLHKQHNSAPS